MVKAKKKGEKGNGGDRPPPFSQIPGSAPGTPLLLRKL